VSRYDGGDDDTDLVTTDPMGTLERTTAPCAC
jgi:hypothetical protein